MQPIDVGFSEQAAGDARLIGNEKDEIACPIEPANRIGGSLDPAQALERDDEIVVGG
jgi:hypothetical protein